LTAPDSSDTVNSGLLPLGVGLSSSKSIRYSLGVPCTIRRPTL
jgi:hypothetical protein